MKKSRIHIAVAACAFALAPDGAAQLLPAGRFRATDGRPREVDAWYIDRAAAQRVIAEVAARANPLVIDYEHQTLAAASNGQAAPAAGWFRPLEWREGEGLFAAGVDWTAKAREMIAAGEYKFLSPVFEYDLKTGAVTRLLMAALTNTPAIDGMDELTARAAARFSVSPEPEEESSMKELLKLLGLAETATEAEAIAALTALQTKLDEANTAVAAAKAETPDPAKYAPVATVQALQTEVAALTARLNQGELDALVARALDEGRLLPAMETWARDLGKANLVALKQYIDSAQPIAALNGTQTGGKPPAGGTTGGALDDTALAICKQLGVSAEDFKKTAAVA